MQEEVKRTLRKVGIGQLQDDIKKAIVKLHKHLKHIVETERKTGKQVPHYKKAVGEKINVLRWQLIKDRIQEK